ncbi:MAG: xanthine dehydrogenase family protein molybdopterin-binding subunit [Lachnospiraceae bacterium]|nr:xanthine dehydrogenase family protein molybdopterin-binding subunit [Lachnospiraceae bacterium]
MARFHKDTVRVDHHEKTGGRAAYIADYRVEGMLYGYMVRSQKAHARIKAIHYPEMPEGYTFVDERDMTTPNYLRNEEDGQFIFASHEVNYIGEGIAVICGPDKAKVKELVEKTVVEYEDLPAVLSMEASDEALIAYHYNKFDADEAFEKAAFTFKETIYGGRQEHVYLETCGIMGEWVNDKVTLTGSFQNPYYIVNEVAEVFKLDPKQVQAKAAYIGGAFGGKEDYPSLLACQAAAAARKAGRPVLMILSRKEDVLDTPKRHPFAITYEAALDEANTITGLRVRLVYDGGAYGTTSPTILQRSLITCTGVYRIPALDVDGRAMKTNHVPSGAFRGFGAPQTHLAIETFMNHLAYRVGEEPLAFKRRHLAKQGDLTSTRGIFHYPVIVNDMIDKAMELSDYQNKKKAYANQTGRMRRGIGMGLSIHGCGFTGSAERDFLKSEMKVTKYADDTVEILACNTDMGQGVRTAFTKIAGEVLDLPYEQIIFKNPDTDRVVNSGPTVASRSVIIPGKLLELCCKELKEIWKRGEEQTVVRKYEHPEFMIPWDLSQFYGDPYPTYSWGVNVIEVELDILTGESHVIGGGGVYDVGVAIDERILRGQIEGGMLQGVGYASMENMEIKDGRIQQASYTDYMIPTAMDTAMWFAMTMPNPYDRGPLGAKGAGELTILGSAPAFVEALEQAAGTEFTRMPLTPERVLPAIEEAKHD